MAILTPLTFDEIERCARTFGITPTKATGVLAGSVNTNFDIVDGHGARWFLRVYEEQDIAGATRDARLLGRLAASGVRTPSPRERVDGAGFVGTFRGKAICLFPYVVGVHRCQASVAPPDVHAVGSALAAMHRVGEGFDVSEGLTVASRFSLDALVQRLTSLDERSLTREIRRAREQLLARLDELSKFVPASRPLPLVHGDLFRDNVLFDEDGRPTLLDFESASIGFAAYDLAVTILAWTFGDHLDASLVSSLVAGYERTRPLGRDEIADLPSFAAMACVRFATTRITDYELRPRGSGAYKDYRRWLSRLEAVDRSFGLRGADLDSTLRDIWPK
ncbi:MAG: homoserine kinase [Polyangiaceae bacterium]|nr:homoserine kinase [Polyangiaceae bacterium]